MKTIRIGAGLGFYGDSWEPVRASIEHGGVQYIASDHLAELTLAILAKDRARDAALGYTRDLVPMLTALWPLAAPRGVKFVLNAGGLNPLGARDALAAAFESRGWAARIVAVCGDDLMPQIDALAASLHHLDSGAPFSEVRERVVFANAYLGAAPIVQALRQGADIVITGRVADAALFLAPLMHEFGWPQDDWQRLAQGLVVGHLLECSGQGSGGNFGSQAAWAKVPDLTHIGYPIAEVSEDGTAVITKAPGTGGRIDFDTVRQQLLYEVHDPRRYVAPDVVLDMSTLRLDDLGGDRVRVTHASGHPRPDKLKVVAGYEDGWMGQCVIGFCWPDAMAKARATIESVRVQLAERHMAVEELHSEFLGHDCFLGPHADRSHEAELNEVWLRMAIRTRERKVADAFPRLFPWMALSGPPYMGGFHGITQASQLLGIWPALVPREALDATVSSPLGRGPARGQVTPEGEERCSRSPLPLGEGRVRARSRMVIRLADIAHARSGDKADRADIGLFAWDSAGYALLEREVTAERVREHFAHLAAPGKPLTVDRYELPNLLALKFVLNGALAGGASRSLRSDNLGKTIGAQLLRMTIEDTR